MVVMRTNRHSLAPLLAACVPVVGVILLALTWGREVPTLLAPVIVAAHVAAVLVAVVHAEAIAHRVGEPFGTLVLALAVTVIEVSLIVTLMVVGGAKTGTLARDTVFAVVMLATNGVLGAAFLANAGRTHVVRFSQQGANALLATLLTLAALGLVLPSFTQSSPGGTFTGAQLAFFAMLSAFVYAAFVFVQTVRHRWMFLAPDALADERNDEAAHVTPHAPDGPADALWWRIVLLVVSLVTVVGLAKVLSPNIESAVVAVGAPPSFVGVVIAAMVLLPEALAALRAARRDEMQTSINLSLGSALASIGLTIPAIAVASIWLDGPITLGLGATEIVLLTVTALVTTLSFGSGQATVLQAVQHLVLCAAFVFLALVP